MFQVLHFPVFPAIYRVFAYIFRGFLVIVSNNQYNKSIPLCCGVNLENFTRIDAFIFDNWRN